LLFQLPLALASGQAMLTEKALAECKIKKNLPPCFS